MGRSKVIDTDHGWKAMLARAKALSGNTAVVVGILGNSSSGGVKAGDGAGLTIQEVAAINEFGTRDGHIPARSFIRSTFDRLRDQLETDIIPKLVVKMLFGDLSPDKAFNLLGLKVASEMKKTITVGAGVPPPNAPSTIAAKGSSRPLVDTGRLVGSISYAIQRGDVQGEPQKPKG